MEFTKIDFTDITVKEEPYHINKEVSFYPINYDSNQLKISCPPMKSTFGVKMNTFNNNEINFVPNQQLKIFLQRIEDFVQKETQNLFNTDTKEFKSCLKQYKEYDEFLKFNVDEKFTRYNKSIDYKGKECNVIFTITGIYVNSKSYGLSFKLNKISLD